MISRNESSALKIEDGVHYLFLIRDYLKQNNIPYDPASFTAMQERKAGKAFSMQEHIRALVYAQLSAQTKWSRVEPHLKEVDRAFNDFDPGFLKSAGGEKLANILFSLSCGSRCTKAQMNALSKNITTMEKIAAEYGSVDAFVTSESAYLIVKKLSSNKSPYKLKWVGDALAWEYLRNVGIDGAKPDVHLKRFLSRERMGKSCAGFANEEEVYAQVEQLANDTGLMRYEVDGLIWSFCADGHGQVCTSQPACYKCPLNAMCRYNKQEACK